MMMMTLLTSLASEKLGVVATHTALVAIRGYQRYLSPYKGFTCAYRVHTGRCSCSQLGYRAVRRLGVFQGFAVLRRRMELCGVAHRRFSPVPAAARTLKSQRGHCDLSCDLPVGGDCNDLPCDCLSMPGSCDWPGRSARRGPDKYVYIPPNSGIGRSK